MCTRSSTYCWKPRTTTNSSSIYLFSPGQTQPKSFYINYLFCASLQHYMIFLLQQGAGSSTTLKIIQFNLFITIQKFKSPFFPFIHSFHISSFGTSMPNSLPNNFLPLPLLSTQFHLHLRLPLQPHRSSPYISPVSRIHVILYPQIPHAMQLCHFNYLISSRLPKPRLIYVPPGHTRV